MDNQLYHSLNNFNLGEMKYTISHDDNRVYLNFYDNYGGMATDSLLNNKYDKNMVFSKDEVNNYITSLVVTYKNLQAQLSYIKTNIGDGSTMLNIGYAKYIYQQQQIIKYILN